MSRQKKKQKPKKLRELCTGTFSSSRNGFGFVTTETEEIFIPAKSVNGAISGDLVSVEVISRSNPLGCEGKIEAILERTKKYFTGVIYDPYTVKPMDPGLPEIRLSGGMKGAKRGDWVRVRLLENGSKFTERLKGTVESHLGRGATLSGDLEAVVSEYGLPEPYSPEMESFAAKLQPLEIKRRDLTHEFTVTIDPSNAKDFDDAISIREDKRFWYIGVHIADVATWVRPGTKLDKAAFSRGFSSYIPTMFRPMLPVSLTRKISLRQGEESPAHTVILKVAKSDGSVKGAERFHSTVRVDVRLDYDSVQKFIETGKSPKQWGSRLKRYLPILKEAAEKMRSYRQKTEEFLSMEISEAVIECDENKEIVTDLRQRTQRESEQLVEECMLAANSAVAEEILKLGIAGLFRIHDEPDCGKLAEFSVFAETILKHRTGDLSNRKNLCRFLEDLPDDHTKMVILSSLLRALQRACYSAEPSIHYGLGKNRYSHFTSPIRRYADLFLHQQLMMHDLKKRTISGKKAEAVSGILLKLEKRNDDAYFAAVDRLKLHYLKQLISNQSGTMFEAVVVKINAHGMICDIPEFGVRGFVPIHKFTTIMHRRPPKSGNLIFLYIDNLDFRNGSAYFRPV